VTASRFGRPHADRSHDLDHRTYDPDCHADTARRAHSGGASSSVTWSQAPCRPRRGRGNGRGPRYAVGPDHRRTRWSTRPPRSLTASPMRHSPRSRRGPYVTRPSGATTYDHVSGPAPSRPAPHRRRLRRRRGTSASGLPRLGNPIVCEALCIRADVRDAIVPIGWPDRGWGPFSCRPEPKVGRPPLRRHCTGPLL
jgi:hypothetical protein